MSRIKLTQNTELKRCPICGSMPLLDKNSLDRGNGHGYPGSYSYTFYCPVCGIVESKGYTDIGGTENEAVKLATKNWNEKCEEIEKYLDWRNK